MVHVLPIRCGAVNETKTKKKKKNLWIESIIESIFWPLLNLISLKFWWWQRWQQRRHWPFLLFFRSFLLLLIAVIFCARKWASKRRRMISNQMTQPTEVKWFRRKLVRALTRTIITIQIYVLYVLFSYTRTLTRTRDFFSIFGCCCAYLWHHFK